MSLHQNGGNPLAGDVPPAGHDGPMPRGRGNRGRGRGRGRGGRAQPDPAAGVFPAVPQHDPRDQARHHRQEDLVADAVAGMDAQVRGAQDALNDHAREEKAALIAAEHREKAMFEATLGVRPQRTDFQSHELDVPKVTATLCVSATVAVVDACFGKYGLGELISAPVSLVCRGIAHLSSKILPWWLHIPVKVGCMLAPHIIRAAVPFIASLFVPEVTIGSHRAEEPRFRKKVRIFGTNYQRVAFAISPVGPVQTDVYEHFNCRTDSNTLSDRTHRSQLFEFDVCYHGHEKTIIADLELISNSLGPAVVIGELHVDFQQRLSQAIRRSSTVMLDRSMIFECDVATNSFIVADVLKRLHDRETVDLPFRESLLCTSPAQ